MPNKPPDNIVKRESLPASAVPFQFQDVQALAKQMLQKANQQGQRIIEAARKQAQDIENTAFSDGKEKGYEEGYQKGLEEGRASGDQAARQSVEEKAQTLAGMLEGLIEELANERLALRNHAEVDLLGLAMAIAEKVIKRSIQIDPAIVAANAEAVIGLTVARRDIALHVAPADYDAVEEFLPSLHETFSDLGRVTLVRDEAVACGGVRAVTHEGEVDLQIDRQLEALERALLGEGDAAPDVAAGDGEETVSNPLAGADAVDAIREAAQVSEAESVVPDDEALAEPLPPDAPAVEEPDLSARQLQDSDASAPPFPPPEGESPPDEAGGMEEDASPDA